MGFSIEGSFHPRLKEAFSTSISLIEARVRSAFEPELERSFTRSKFRRGEQMMKFLRAAHELGEEMGKLEMRLKEGTVQVEGEEVEESRRRIQELYLQVGGRVNIRILYLMSLSVAASFLFIFLMRSSN